MKYIHKMGLFRSSWPKKNMLDLFFAYTNVVENVYYCSRKRISLYTTCISKYITMYMKCI